MVLFLVVTGFSVSFPINEDAFETLIKNLNEQADKAEELAKPIIPVPPTEQEKLEQAKRELDALFAKHPTLKEFIKDNS